MAGAAEHIHVVFKDGLPTATIGGRMMTGLLLSFPSPDGMAQASSQALVPSKFLV